MKFQIVPRKFAPQNVLIAPAEIDDAEVTEAIADILNNLVRLRFIQDEFISLLPELLNQIDKGVDCERVVLGGHTKAPLFRTVVNKPRFQQLHLLNDLPCIAEKFHALRCQCDTGSSAVKHGQSGFLLDASDRAGQTWL